MIIQWILIAGLLLALGYAVLQRRKSRMVSLTIAMISLAGIYFVVFPDDTSRLAHLMGIGRGADLVFYCWIVINLVVCVNLQFKILNLQELVTELTREIAVRTPRFPEAGLQANRSTTGPSANRSPA